jgi:hypothetical protein
MATESQEGLGENVVLSLFDDSRIRDFFDHTDEYRRAPVGTDFSPTQVICDFLAAGNYVSLP